MLRRGSIPVTVFVISVIVLFAFALLLLSVYNAKGANNILRGYTAVREFNVEVGNSDFLGGNVETLDPVVKFETGFLGTERDVVSVEVRYVPES